MSPSPVDRLDACIVLHDPRRVAGTVQRLARVAALARCEVQVIAMTTASGAVDPRKVEEACRTAGVTLLECSAVDDRYLDFSGYAKAARTFADRDSDGVLFINDTLPEKHDSPYLHSAMARTVAAARSRTLPFPVLVGPYRHSEFSVGNGTADEFVSTFMLYLNRPGLRCLFEVMASLPACAEALGGSSSAQGPDADIIRFCLLHAVQIEPRYRHRDDAAEILIRKLATSFAERALSRRARNEGVVWYVGSGLSGRLRVPLECAWSRLRRRLGPGGHRAS